MRSFDDTILIAKPKTQILQLLSDLSRHPSYVPDGFKNYRYLTPETDIPGAKAAIELNLLGHWLPSELELRAKGSNAVVFHVNCMAAELTFRFSLTERKGRTEVTLDVDSSRNLVAPWRVRTRLKQRLRLERDIATLCRPFLSMLKEGADTGKASVPGSIGYPPQPGPEIKLGRRPRKGSV